MKTLTHEEAEDIVWGDHVTIQDVSTHRWYTKQLVVFHASDEEYAIEDARYWGFYYLDPLTEMQDGQDVFETDPVEVFPVASHTVTKTIYERADDV